MALAVSLLTGLPRAGAGDKSAGWSALPPPATAVRPAAGPVGSPRTVTLITGDRVTVYGADTSGGPTRLSVEPGKGRAGIPITSSRVGGHLRVEPVDALPLLRDGTLDPRLFDVTGLLADGYDGAGDLPLVVVHGAGSAAAATAVATAADARVTHPLPQLRSLAVRAGRRDPAKVWTGLTTVAAGRRTLRPGLTKVWLDALMAPAVDADVQQIGAPTAWQSGYTGAGVTVAVLDSGIDDTHPDLAGKVVARRNFTDGAEDDLDHAGHGTHVASIVAGTGAASGGTHGGVAPRADLIDGKVCAVNGCQESSILAGMEWAAGDQHARVVNLSMGEPDSPGTDPVEAAVNTLSEQDGTLFVVSAGNAGADGSIGTPGSADAALTVGAVDGADALAGFSSRGPRLGDGGLKPDLTAPGVDITAARSTASDLGRPGDSYVTLSGTSMAAPHVSGAAAILLQEHPDWTAARLKATLMASAAPNRIVAVYRQGAGRFADPGPAGDFVGSPYVYNLAWYDRGRVPDSFTRRVTDQDLAAVRTRFLTQATGSTGLSYTWDEATPPPALSFTVPLPVSLPRTVTEYYNTDVPWAASVQENPAGGGSGPDSGFALARRPTTYRPGQVVDEVWDHPMYGPVLYGPDQLEVPSVFRWTLPDGSEEIQVRATLLADAAGHEGVDTTAAAHTALFRDGTEIGAWDRPGNSFFAVPAAAARYRLTAGSTRSPTLPLSTKVTAAWTFRSAAVTSTVPRPLPLSVVRFAPVLDDSGTAPAGHRFTVPVTVVAQPGSAAARNTTLTVDVSFDDGHTWRSAAVRDGAVTIDQPAGGTFVSLRATATDADGNTVQQAVIRAYRVAAPPSEPAPAH